MPYQRYFGNPFVAGGGEAIANAALQEKTFAQNIEQGRLNLARRAERAQEARDAMQRDLADIELTRRQEDAQRQQQQFDARLEVDKQNSQLQDQRENRMTSAQDSATKREEERLKMDQQKLNFDLAKERAKYQESGFVEDQSSPEASGPLKEGETFVNLPDGTRLRGKTDTARKIQEATAIATARTEARGAYSPQEKMLLDNMKADTDRVVAQAEDAAGLHEKRRKDVEDAKAAYDGFFVNGVVKPGKEKMAEKAKQNLDRLTQEREAASPGAAKTKVAMMTAYTNAATASPDLRNPTTWTQFSQIDWNTAMMVKPGKEPATPELTRKAVIDILNSPMAQYLPVILRSVVDPATANKIADAEAKKIADEEAQKAANEDAQKKRYHNNQ